MKIPRAIDFTMKNHHKFILVWYLFLPSIGKHYGKESNHTVHCNQVNAVTVAQFCFEGERVRGWPRSNRRWSRSNIVCHLATVSGIPIGVKFVRDAFYSGASTCLCTGARRASSIRHSCTFGGAAIGGSARTGGTGVRQHIFQMIRAAHA